MLLPEGLAFRTPRAAVAHALVALSAMGWFGLACTSQSRPATPAIEGQTYAEAIQSICEVDRHISVPDGTNELETAQMRDDYIVENTKNPDAIYFVTLWRTKSLPERATMLQKEARDQRLKACPLATQLSQIND